MKNATDTGPQVITQFQKTTKPSITEITVAKKKTRESIKAFRVSLYYYSNKGAKGQ
jgi:hypothetical protein